MSVFFLLGRGARRERPAFIVTDVHHGRPRSAGRFGRRRGAVAGAVVLRKELFDAEHGGVVDQVPSAAASSPTGTQGVGPQRRAVVHIWKHLLLQATGG